IQQDRRFTLDLARRAEAAGYRALVLTVDAPVNGVRNREQRAGFALPPELAAPNLRGMPPAPATTLAPGESLFASPLLAAAATWRDVEDLRGQVRLPLLL